MLHYKTQRRYMREISIGMFLQIQSDIYIYKMSAKMILQTFYFICEKEGKIYTVIESLLTLLSPNRFDSYKLLFDARDRSRQSSQYDAFSSQARDYFPQALNAAFNLV